MSDEVQQPLSISEDPSRNSQILDWHTLRLWCQELFEFTSEAQLLTDSHGVILEANQSALALLKHSKAYLLDKPLGMCIYRGHQGRFYESLINLRSKQTTDGFESRLRSNGSVRDAVVRGYRLNLGSGVPLTFRWLITDVSELKQNEVERRRSEIERRNLLRRLVDVQESERQRVSRDLHDRMGQDLTGLILGLKALESEMEEDSPVRRRLVELQETVDRLGREVHDLAVELRPTALDDLGLQAALETLVSRWIIRTGIPVNSCFLVPNLFRFRPETETTVYRIVQEALTNIAKHASACHVGVIVERQDHQLSVLVEDDGHGFDPEYPNNGRLGLLGMCERASLVGGTLQIESSPGTGTTVLARIPL